MEFKKINDRRFQCRLDEEDLEDNNISLDDFFKNDTDKIHSLLEVIMEEAEKNIGVTLSGEVMSLQLAPQPDHSILLTVSSGKERSQTNLPSPAITKTPLRATALAFAAITSVIINYSYNILFYLTI